ncbi:LysM peptidoglycan-binding domain-containing protein [uncultured Desulfobacter sp.]|uniref:LysM peptidoglycan-binding domain-containing protein n=1 Tax=uncultured Desulfobacter sp. TaxID=240139 RepID=UPI0029F4DC02|nr:LysM peptidoglycan-binding domain-containing protein [uncultured Desulfobacter sp.]
MENASVYIVKKGDTLWDLAEKYLNDPIRWPEIWHFNNKLYAAQSSTMSIKPSMLIKNPDLIFVGQKLLIPTSYDHRQTVQPSLEKNGKTPAKDKIRMIPYKFKIENKIFETYLPGGFKAKINIKGDLTIQSEKTITWAALNTEGMELKVAREYETPLNRLVTDYQLGINEKTRQIEFACGVTMHSKIPYAPKYQAQVSINQLTGMPKYITTISYPPIKGKLGHYFYAATGYCVAIEIEKLPDIARRVPRPIPVQQPAKAPLRSPGPDWFYIGGVLLLVGAAAVVTATVVEDIVTFGAGVADDPASFALAATMTARGITLLRGAQITVTQLGRGAVMAPAF